jgi:hypothetical protein
MASPEQIELWNQIEADLRRAYETLPPGAVDDESMREFHYMCDHNELELACDALEAVADKYSMSREFWTALRDAATRMNLKEHAKRYAGRANDG